MQESKFRFIKPGLTSVNFQVNPYIKREDYKTWPVTISMETNVSKSENLPEALVELIVKLNYGDSREREEKAPFWCTAVYMSKFVWDESVPDEMVDKLLDVNAPSVLLSYVRPLISHITAASPLPSYDIPFLNIAELEKTVTKDP